jgi:hypothetical protein
MPEVRRTDSSCSQIYGWRHFLRKACSAMGAFPLSAMAFLIQQKNCRLARQSRFPIFALSLQDRPRRFPCSLALANARRPS